MKIICRSRVRQTGAVIADDITSYPSFAKRKNAANLRSKGVKQEKTRTPAREISVSDSRVIIETLLINETKNDEIDLAGGIITDIPSIITENIATFCSLDDEECSRQSFDTYGGGKLDEECEEDEDANEKEEESNANDSAVTLLFSKNSLETSLEFNQLVNFLNIIKNLRFNFKYEYNKFI